MRRLPAICLVLLVVTSGCAGLFSGQNPSPGPSESTTTVSQSELPPGVNGQWLYNPDRLMEAHRSTLSATNYRVRARVTRNTSALVSEWRRLDLRAHIGDGTVFANATGSTRSIGSSSPFSFYRWNSSQAVRWSDRSFGYTYLHWPDGEQSALVNEQMKRALTLGDFIVNGTETHNGTEYVRLQADGTSDPKVRDFSATALVGTNGRIRELSGSLVTNRSVTADTTARVTFDYEFRTADSPPSIPDWVRGVPHLTLGRTDDGEGIVLRNGGGAALPAETNFSFSASAEGHSLHGYLNLSEAVRPGEQMVFYAIRNGDGVTLSPNARSSANANESILSLEERYVTVSGRPRNTLFSLSLRSERDVNYHLVKDESEIE